MTTKFGIHHKVKNIEKSLKFYKDFGFKEVFGYGDIKFLAKLDKSIPKVLEKYNGAVFEIGGALLEIADGHIAVKPEVFRQKIESSKLSAMIHVDSVDHVVKVCGKNDYKILVAPKVFPWGTREVVIRDPDGFVLVFIEKLKK